MDCVGDVAAYYVKSLVACIRCIVQSESHAAQCTVHIYSASVCENKKDLLVKFANVFRAKWNVLKCRESLQCQYYVPIPDRERSDMFIELQC